MNIPLISMFTGGGLLDIGFEKAGFHIVWTNEAKHSFADMYEYGVSAWKQAEGIANHPVNISCRKCIAEVNPIDIFHQAFGQNPPDIFGLIGGPPCPDFSIGGMNVGNKGNSGKLTEEFWIKIRQIMPTFFLMENVPGLVRTKKHRSYFDFFINRIKKIGYIIDWKILNSLEYGVPQSRERVFVIGVRNDILYDNHFNIVNNDRHSWFPWPSPTHPLAPNLSWPRINKFGDIPQLPENIPLELTVWPYVGGKDDPETLPNGQDCFNPYSKKFWEIAEGDVYSKSFKRLHRYRYSPAAWYGNNEVHLHPWKPRRLSVRETLRIQSVPDSYILPDNMPLSEKFKLICNGVPCILAEHLALSVMKFIRNHLH